MLQVAAHDKTGLMIDIMKMEIEKFNGIREKFIDEWSQEDFDYIDQVGDSIMIKGHQIIILAQ